MWPVYLAPIALIICFILILSSPSKLVMHIIWNFNLMYKYNVYENFIRIALVLKKNPWRRNSGTSRLDIIIGIFVYHKLDSILFCVWVLCDLCLFEHSGVQHILCCVFALFLSVLCYVASFYGLSFLIGPSVFSKIYLYNSILTNVVLTLF